MFSHPTRPQTKSRKFARIFSTSADHVPMVQKVEAKRSTAFGREVQGLLTSRPRASSLSPQNLVILQRKGRSSGQIELAIASRYSCDHDFHDECQREDHHYICVRHFVLSSIPMNGYFEDSLLCGRHCGDCRIVDWRMSRSNVRKKVILKMFSKCG